MKTKDTILLEQAYNNIVAKQQINTFGDLLKVIQGIQLKNKGSKILDKTVSFTVDQILGLIPGASNAKTAFEFLKTAFGRSDTKKTGTFIDKLNVDDRVAMIVDNSIEQKFLLHLVDIIKQKGADTIIPDNWNVTNEFQDFLRKNYDNRTVVVPSVNK